MGRKQSAEKIEFGVEPAKQSGSGAVLSIIQFTLFLLLVPALIGFSEGFYREIALQRRFIIDYAFFGAILYLVLHVFICKPVSLHNFAQGLIRKAFGFTGPLKIWLGYFLPLYGIIVFLVYLFADFFMKHNFKAENIIFFFAFFGMMHLSLVVSDLRENEAGALKTSYLFSFSLVFLVNMLIFGFFLSVIIKDFSVVRIIRFGWDFVSETYLLIWRQLFVIR